MEVSVLSFADYAQEVGGKLTIVGIFDEINSTELPCVHSFYIVGRFKLSAGEDLFKVMSIRGHYEGEDKDLFPPIDGNAENLEISKGKRATLNFILNFNNLQFEKEGTYLIEIKTDNGFSSIMPLKVNLLKQ